MKFKKHLAIGIILLLLALLPKSAACSGGTFSPDIFKGVQKEVLPNGLTIITLVDRSWPVVSINFFVRAGSVNENSSNNGVSHFCEHMFYRGTGSFSGMKMKSAIESLGGSFNAETTRDYTRYYVDVPTEYGFEALKIYCDALADANYEEEQLEHERKVILEEYNLMSENPSFIIQSKLYSEALPGHPYSRDIIGTLHTIKNLSRSDLLDYKRRLYSPENIAVVIVGDFNRKKYLDYISRKFERLPENQTPPDAGVSGRFVNEKKEIVEEKPYPINYAYFTLAFPSPSIKSWEDVLAMDVLVFMLGQGDDSILSKQLSGDKKLVRSVGTEFITSRYPGLVIFIAEVTPYKVQELKKSILSIIGQLQSGQFSSAEVERARTLLVKSFVYGAETNRGKAEALGFYEMLKDMDLAVNYIDGINKVTREDIIRVARKYFDENYVLYVLRAQKEDS